MKTLMSFLTGLWELIVLFVRQNPKEIEQPAQPLPEDKPKIPEPVQPLKAEPKKEEVKMANYQDAINKVLQAEGGYVNHALDRGGRTNYGITQAVYETFIGRKLVGPTTDALPGQPMSEAETVMRNMPLGNALTIYKNSYWDKVGGDKIRKFAIAAIIFDQSVNRGVSAAVRQAQRVLSSKGYAVIQDGVPRQETIDGLNTINESLFINSYLQESIIAYQTIVKNNPSQQVFLSGWLSRVESLRKYANSYLGTINGAAPESNVSRTIASAGQVLGGPTGIAVIVLLGVGSYLIYRNMPVILDMFASPKAT